MESKNRRWIVVFAGCLLVLSCCVLVVCLGAAGLVIYRGGQVAMDPFFLPTFEFSWEYSNNPTPAPTLAPTFRRTEVAGTPVPVQEDMLEALGAVQIPPADPYDLARRMEGKTNLPPKGAVPAPAAYTAGDRKSFWVLNSDTAAYSQVQAVLRYVGEQVNFWIEDGVRYDHQELVRLVDTFSSEIYPDVRGVFGSERTPGVDGDPRLVVLYTTGMGRGVAGYFSSSDAYPPEVVEYSNGHDMFVLSASNLSLNSQFTYGVLAHEFQHMIHWASDNNEEGWLNEGLAELSALVAGYQNSSFDETYAADPDIPLLHWPASDGNSYPFYGGSYLFMAYFWGQYGSQAVQSLISHPENGLTSLDMVLLEPAFSAPAKQADDLFQDWTIANYLGLAGESLSPRYSYPEEVSSLPVFSPVETISTCPTDEGLRAVNQYGVDYVEITCPGTYRLSFEGSTLAPVVSAEYRPGSDFAYWSNRANESNMTLSRSFDFRSVNGPLTLSYWVWYDLEQGYDFVYLLASTDDGETWEFLDLPSGVRPGPDDFNYGPAYNGSSRGWKQETLDLSRFAGQKVTLQFEYVTDTAVVGEGFLLDEIAIPEIGYLDDVEPQSDGWQAAGFVRLKNELPQTYRLALITHGRGTEVTYLSLSPVNTADVEFSVGGEVEAVTLVVSATTRFTSVPAAYRLQILP